MVSRRQFKGVCLEELRRRRGVTMTGEAIRALRTALLSFGLNDAAVVQVVRVFIECATMTRFAREFVATTVAALYQHVAVSQLHDPAPVTAHHPDPAAAFGTYFIVL